MDLASQAPLLFFVYFVVFVFGGGVENWIFEYYNVESDSPPCPGFAGVFFVLFFK